MLAIKWVLCNGTATIVYFCFLIVEVWSCLALQEMGQVLAPIIKNFYNVMKCASTNQAAASQLVSSMKSFHELFKLCWSDEFIQTFDRYAITWLWLSASCCTKNKPGS